MNEIEENLGQVSISFEYSRHLGPRYVHGAVRLRFDAFRAYSFRSTVVWPDGANYESAVREAIESVLREKCGSLERVEVVLQSIVFDTVNSCESGFRNAARVATEAAFRL